ncbi:MAG: hypothetical protein L3J07_02475 [Candidatus Magasanikbacteria bacterium]|nr:hypothetical protein [Candidatus Magasanikbacteria bacterium]
MEKLQILIALSAKDKKSDPLNQSLIFTEDFKIFAIFSQEQFQKLTYLYEISFDNTETQNLLPTHSEKEVIEINCDPNTNPALYLMFMDLSDLYTIRVKMEKDLGKILGIEAKKTYLFNTLFPLKTDFDKDVSENPIQDTEIPKEVKFEETPFCKSCDNLEPFTPTITLNVGEFCLKCCDFPIGNSIAKQRIKLAITKRRVQLQMDYYYLKAEGLEIELSDLP